jgi:hypothetical protein
MPMTIEHIDAIARREQRDVLYVCFHPQNWGDLGDDGSWLDYDYDQDDRRNAVIMWLDDHSIPWVECGPIASETCMRSYLGEIYIDIPFDEGNPQYQLLRDYLEYPDGTMRDENVRFYYLSLEDAMKNAHHDDPGFWERWAEEF